MNGDTEHLRDRFREVHKLLDTRLSGLPLAGLGTHAELVWREDLTVNGVLAECAPLALSTWRRRTGLSELPPIGRLKTHSRWVERVHVDVVGLRSYARAVYAATDDYLSSLTPMLDRSNMCVLNALLLMLSTRCASVQLIGHQSSY